MPRYETVLKCGTCGEIIPCGVGSQAKADEHEQSYPDHWMQYQQIEVSAK